MKKKIMTVTIYVLIAVAILGLGACSVFQLPVFGGKPEGERLERMKRSPHFRDGAFENLEPTVLMVEEDSGGLLKNLWEFVFKKRPGVRPEQPLRMVKRDLKHLSPEGDFYAWFGHSSYLLSLHGTTILVDPVFETAAPFAFLNKPFEGTDKYHADDMPPIDYLVISHDHYDHLDYQTVKRLKDRVGHVVCPLGVGAHFEHWGYEPGQIVEMDWDESQTFPDSLSFHCLPARHFSGRTLKRNGTLWASFLVSTPRASIFLGGDSGYGKHFREIGRRHPQIDLAILENGQYNRQWAQIHTMPDELGREAVELRAKQIITVHHSKFALARHAWDEPLKNELKARKDYALDLIVVPLGEVVPLNLGK